MNSTDISHILTHLGEERENYFNAMSPPIIQTSNFTFPTLSKFKQAFDDELASHLYTRGNNPTVEILRKKLAALEGTEDCLVFASGSAAISSAIIAQVKQGDHIVCVKNPYSWTHNLLTKFLPRFGVTTTFVASNTKAITEACQGNTKLIMLESPNSATFEIQDLAAIAQFAQSHDILTAIDNSYSSPIFQNPAKHGIDIILHSGTKYINGHSDVVVGVCCTSKKIVDKIAQSEYMTLGAILGPHEAAMVIRGLRTLPIRMEKIQKTTEQVIRFLNAHPKIEKVLYPWDPSFPQYELAKKQMSGAGGLFSILIKAKNIEEIEIFAGKLKRFLFAVSWGGHESLALPFCIFNNQKDQGKDSDPEIADAKSAVPWNLVRLSIGLEEPEVLIEDLEQALGA